MDPAHPSERGLSKYKDFAWDAMGGADFLSIKILDGWNFQESTNTTKGTSFESYAREMKMLFSTKMRRPCHRRARDDGST